jgi:hypothetical protein
MDELKQACLSFQEIAGYARTGDYGYAASQLNRTLQSVEKYLTSPAFSKELYKKISFSLETLLLMQERKDWVAFADILEYELIPLLSESL